MISASEIAKNMPLKPKQMTCPKHGDYFGYSCQQCLAEYEKKEAQGKLRRFIAHQKTTMNLPKRFSHCSFSNYQTQTPKQKRVVNKIIEYGKNLATGNNTGGFLSLLGSVGTGKTHLVCALANYLITQGVSVKYQTTNQVISRISYAAKNFNTNTWQVIADLTEFDLLILDELGTQDQKYNNHLFELINQYYSHLKPMVIVSNLGEKGLKTNIGERVLDRMKHNGTVLGLDWESWRLKNE